MPRDLIYLVLRACTPLRCHARLTAEDLPTQRAAAYLVMASGRVEGGRGEHTKMSLDVFESQLPEDPYDVERPQHQKIFWC